MFARLNESVGYGLENPLDYDAWDGYQSNRDRVLTNLYNNKIMNTIFLSGDSHANWVSDLSLATLSTTLNNIPYDPETGDGAVGVELSGTAVSSPSPYNAIYGGKNLTTAQYNNISSILVQDNTELQWSDIQHRGYFELILTPQKATAYFFGMTDILTRNNQELLLATFETLAGSNKLTRPIAGGKVSAGAVRGGSVVPTSPYDTSQVNPVPASKS